MNDLAKLASSVDHRAYQQPAQAVGQGPQATTDYYSHPADHPGNRSGSPTGTGRSKHSNPNPNPNPIPNLNPDPDPDCNPDPYPYP